jgi:hypothetical protein
MNSASFVLEVNSCTTLKEETTFSPELYPNPNAGVFTVVLRSESRVRVTDVTGKLVYSRDAVDQGKHVVELPGVDKGVYFVTVSDTGGSHTFQMIVQ